MVGLLEYINASATRDADGTWKWEHNPPPIPMFAFKEAVDFLVNLPDKSEVKLLPVQTWQRDSDSVGKMLNGLKNPIVMASRFSEDIGMTLAEGIFKLNYTNNTISSSLIRTPSLFVSPDSGRDKIQPGQKFILLDDNMESGSTVADLVRHVNNRGGIVIGFIDGSNTPHCHTMSEPVLSQSYANGIQACFWALENKQPGMKYSGDAEKIWKTVPEEERTSFVAKVQEEANRGLSHLGTNFEQGTGHVRGAQTIMNGLSSLFDPPHWKPKYTTMEAFWQWATKDVKCPWPVSIDAIKKPAELAETLGVEWQISVAAGTLANNRNVRDVAGNSKDERESSPL